MARKYWDIIPPKKKTGRQINLEKIQEFLERESKQNRKVMPYRMPFTPQIGGCLHKNCGTCHGTGYSPYGKDKQDITAQLKKAGMKGI